MQNYEMLEYKYDSLVHYKRKKELFSIGVSCLAVKEAFIRFKDYVAQVIRSV